MAQKCADFMNVKNVEIDFVFEDRTEVGVSILWGRAGYGNRPG